MILKIGMPVLCFAGSEETPLLGCIVDTQQDIDTYESEYKILWADDDEQWYEEKWTHFYWKQAQKGYIMRREAERLEEEDDYGY